MEHPDALEKRIRFGCGFILGLVIAAITSLFFAIANGYYIAALCIVFGVIMGFGAVEYGDASGIGAQVIQCGRGGGFGNQRYEKPRAA